MGCDIHAIVEYEDAHGVHALADGRLKIPRQYNLFGALAGIRSSHEPLIRPRGLPERCSAALLRLYCRSVPDESGKAYRPCEPVEQSWAQMQVASGRSTFVAWGSNSRGFVTMPDWHSLSWLTPAEVADALKLHDVDRANLSPQFRAIQAMMEELARHMGPQNVRLVFWFDN